MAAARETSCFGGPKSTWRKGGSAFTSKCRFLGRCSTVDMVVIVEALFVNLNVQIL